MNKNLEDLVIGRKYKLKSKKWFDENGGDMYHYNKASFHGGDEVTLCDIVNGNSLVLKANNGEEFWLKENAVEEISGQPEPNKEILNAIKKLKIENYIYGYNGGNGGGNGETINTQKSPILPVIGKDGTQSIFIQIDGMKRVFSINNIRELFDKGKTEQGFKVTEYTTIRTELKLIKDKTELPKSSSWVSNGYD
jgi:hypothetical protein